MKVKLTWLKKIYFTITGNNGVSLCHLQSRNQIFSLIKQKKIYPNCISTNKKYTITK